MKKIGDIKILSKEEFLSLESTKSTKEAFKQVSDDQLYESYKSKMGVALEQLERANKGDAKAQYTVGTFFQNEDFFGVSWEDAKDYYVMAAEQNHPFAALQLAIHLRVEISEREKEGRLDGIDQLTEKAKRYYRIYKDHRTGPKECEVTYPELEG